jgi:uncharacterized glyoxalase superfamily protein PhnB
MNESKTNATQVRSTLIPEVMNQFIPCESWDLQFPIGFVMKDAAQAEAWHKAGVANGGTSIEDPPGKRPNGAYLAYLRDPDGHKLVGVAR